MKYAIKIDISILRNWSQQWYPSSKAASTRSNVTTTKYFAYFSIAYDGKKSLSAAGKNRKEKIDHYTVVSSGRFLDLFVPENGTGAQLAFKLHELLKNYLAENSLIYIGCDR